MKYQKTYTCSKCKGGGYLAYPAPQLGAEYVIPKDCKACKGVGFFIGSGEPEIGLSCSKHPHQLSQPLHPADRNSKGGSMKIEPVACYAQHRLTPKGTTEFYGYADKPLNLFDFANAVTVKNRV